jgi:hypothetical protein
MPIRAGKRMSQRKGDVKNSSRLFGVVPGVFGAAAPLAVTVTLTMVGVVVAPSGEPVTMKLYEPVPTEDATSTVNPLFTPVKRLFTSVKIGVTGFTVKVPQVIPAGRLLPTQDNVTDCAVPAVRVAVMYMKPELPCVTFTGPLFDKE